MSDYRIETKCIQSGYEPENGEPRIVPIYQSTTFRYTSSEQMGRLFDLEESGYFYTRLQNPTNDAVAAKICDLEGGTAAMLTSSGQAANFYAVMNIAQAGDHIVCASALYGGTYNLYAHTIRKMGVEATFVDPDCTEEELEAAFQDNTKAVFGESIANPALVVLDFEKFAKAAHRHGVPFIVDNTFATPINCRPFEWGADIVTHSTTKYMDGHAACVGGAIVDSGNFDWMAHAEKFPGLTTPDETYHGIVYAEKFGKRFIPTYGQTEGTARMAYLEPEMAKYKIGSIGKAEPNGKLSIVSDEGVETFEGEAEGEMVYRGENVTLGYATSADDLVKDDENHGVLYTGDIVRRDADGYYFVVGRKKRFLKIFGLRIGLDEVEHLVKSAFDTDCLCGGTDELLTVRITNAQIVEQVRDFIVEKTKLFHKNFEVLVVDKINRNEAGKAVLNN